MTNVFLSRHVVYDFCFRPYHLTDVMILYLSLLQCCGELFITLAHLVNTDTRSDSPLPRFRCRKLVVVDKPRRSDLSILMTYKLSRRITNLTPKALLEQNHLMWVPLRYYHLDLCQEPVHIHPSLPLQQHQTLHLLRNDSEEYKALTPG